MYEEVRKKGVTGIPLILIDGKWAVKGGQPSDVLVQVRAGHDFILDLNLISLIISTRSSRSSPLPTRTPRPNLHR